MPTNSTHAAATTGIASRAAETAHGVVDKVADVATPMVDRFTNSAHATVNRAASAANKLEEKSADLLDASTKLLTSSRDYVVGKPLIVLGFGLAVGILISRLIR